ncbi:hypothetical protein COV93_06070 [Candidatus Woesearchaeota archaeon CG11_big_fil_rev_8_21_14_0_20_43_8]|nr:MAG: hypothetical protein COV93_06070 [Candidatus Woesearchaeota archaeon CG11_big_fil_rev_8_21_14_0_20_43_8]
MKTGVISEADKAKVVLMHTPSVEVFYGSLFPSGALYEQQMNLSKAVEEHKTYISELENAGVKVVNLRDVLEYSKKESLIGCASKSLKYDLDAIEDADKSALLQEKSRVIESMCKKSLVDTIMLKPTIQVVYSKEQNVRFDCRYQVNPVMNQLFLRDQQIVTERGVIMGKMNSSQRALETEITKLAFSGLGITPKGEVEGEGRLEGGDYIPLNGSALLGIGLRTNMDAAAQLLRKDLFGKKEIALVLDPYKSQDEMHLDTYMNLPSYHKAVILEDRLDSSKKPEKIPTVMVFKKEKGFYTKDLVNTGATLECYLKKKGFDIIPMTKQEQLNYGVNFLTVEDNKVIGVKQSGDEYISRIEGKGISFKALDFTNLTSAYGGPHCLTQILCRE